MKFAAFTEQTKKNSANGVCPKLAQWREAG